VRSRFAQRAANCGLIFVSQTDNDIAIPDLHGSKLPRCGACPLSNSPTSPTCQDQLKAAVPKEVCHFC
jgi:hypothetical protein